MRAQHRLFACGIIVGVSCPAIQTAHAEASDSEKIERLQRQTNELEKQLKALRRELEQSKKKAASSEKAASQTASAPSAKPADAAPDSTAKGVSWWQDTAKKVKITPGGYIQATAVYREHNAVNNVATSFASIPFPYQPIYGEHEFHASARHSRLSLLTEGDMDSFQKIQAYFEVDFLGVGTNSNYVQSNSWPPRLRHAFLNYDNLDWGVHVLAGQTWSLITQNKEGIIARKENIPPTIETNYVAGFNYTRNTQLRFVKDFDKKVWLALSLENPATVDGVPGAVTTGSATSITVDGLTANISNIGTGSLAGVNATPDHIPDVIEKIAFDPGWGHYEIVGVQRFFTDNVFCGNPADIGCSYGATDLKTTFGAGVGGSALLPIIPKYLDLQATILYGDGIGRYGTSLLPDVTIARDGSLEPLTALQTYGGIVARPWEGSTLYAFYGVEEVDSHSFDVNGAHFGWGNPAYINAGCLTASPKSFAGGPAPLGGCAANTKRITDITVGFWQDLYKGAAGRIEVGAQWEHITRDLFFGVGGAPSTSNDIIFTSLRYHPF